MTGALAVAAADMRERTRTFATFVLIAGALQLGYLFVPDATAPYATVDLGGWRGFYNSAWMGAATALLSVSFLPLAGFFLVRPALSRDATLGTLELVFAAPLSRVTFVLGKWLSDVWLLAGVAAIVMLAAVVMQLVRGESRHVDALAYLLPYLLITVPACAVTATCAIVSSALPGLRGILGGVLWFFVWTGFFMIAFLPTQGVRIAALDPLGLTTVTAALFSSLHAHAAGAAISNDVSIGGSSAVGLKLFHFDGITWTLASVAQRIGWCLASAASCAAVAPFALRFAAPRARTSTSPVARIIANLPLPPLIRAEVAQVFGTAGTWWTLGAAVITVAAIAAPPIALERGIAPLAWIWPIGPIAALGILDARTGLDGVLLATPTPAWKRIAVRWLAAFTLALAPIAALAGHHGSAGIAIVALAAAACAIGIAFGAFARSPFLFECLALIAWYLGPVNRVPGLDPAQSVRAPFVVASIALAVGLAALGAAAFRASRRS